MKIRLPLLPVIVTAFVGGCATQPVPEKSIIVSADQTELVMPVGSHIRTRVLKGQNTISSLPTETISGDQLNNALLTRDGSIPSVPVH